MEDDEGDTSVAVEKSAVAGNTENQDGIGTTVLLKNTKAKKSSRSPLKGKDAVKSECGDSVKLCSNVETEPTACDIKSQNSNNKLANSSDVPKSPKKVNGEVELPKCDRVESTSGEDCISETTVAEGSKSPEIERTKSESEKVNNRKCKQKVRPVYEEMKNTGSNSDGNLEYKGFKKRILARTSASRKAASQDTSQGSPRSVLKSKKLSVKKTVSESRHILVSHQKLPDGTQSSAQLTEYAQYLGLQPTVKFKCYKCGESGFPSMIKLQEHQYICLKNVNKMQSLLKPPVPQSSEPAPSTNFRITRKVYLCSACGTYYENWNLFLHMREVHKRHICLFCLGMFSQADKLATHLSGKHGVIEMLYNSLDHFEHEFKGSFFLMCCSCERIFTERENFFDHSCNEGLVINTDKGYCSLCGVRGAHFPTCRQAFTDNNSSPPPSSSVMGTSERPSESTQNSQPAIPERSLTVTKYLIPINKGSGKKTNQNQNVVLDNMGENQEKSRELSDIDDEYDISNAASFCHVNIHEPSDKQKSVIAPKVKTYKSKNQNVATKKVTEAKPPVTSPTGKVTSPNSKLSEGTVCLETCTQKKHEADKSTNIESDDATVGSKGSQERDQNSDIKSNKISVPPDVCKESVELKTNEQDEKPESSHSDAEKTPDIQENHKRDSPVMEESDLHSEDDIKQAEHETNLKSPLQREINTKLSPKSDNSLKTSPRTETKVGSKTPSATEADSESESSDSGEDTGESSSSTDISSEESEHHDGAEEKREEEKIYESDDNADSDKMSLIVDENRSDDDSESQKENIDDVEKDSKEDKICESEEIKKDEVRRDIDEMEQKIIESEENKLLEEEKVDEPTESVQVAGDDVPLLELTLEENLDTMNIQMLLKESVKVSCLNCVYCNHAKKIAVNGKQLALHLLAEHRFAPVVCSDSGELTEADGFVDRLKIALPELQQMFFNTDSYDNMDETCMHPYDRTYECFHCHFVTTLHKELYVHNRKMHQKTILLCIMCKSNFYSYSELLCHLCPGIYVPESNISFRCCLCTVDGLPSAFRLMVHLRKRHHACDVCLETTGDQQKLSNHVWKHKLHHLCYRCGIAYRNKPDITKHLFWKHGTESVLCKKCLQKKWPHVYHFCIPPNAFLCEDCNCSFSRAVALKVHKRLHADDLPYPCNECEERFISRKLLTKHQEKHREPPPEDSVEGKLEENGLVKESESHKEDIVHKAKIENVSHVEADALVSENANTNIPSKAEVQGSDTKLTASLSEPEAANVPAEPSVAGSSDEALKPEEKEVEEKKSKVVDVYDLPPLNLSSDSDDSDEDGEKKVQSTVKTDDLVSVADNANVNVTDKISETLSQTEEDNQQPVQVVDGIWDNFKTYKANLERRESQQVETGESSIQKSENVLEIQPYVRDTAEVISVINMDHDYCGLVVGTSYAAEMERQLENTSMTETETVQPTSQPQVETEKLEEAKEEREEESNVCGDDHNYCYTNTTSLCVEKEKENIVAAAAASTVPPTASTTKKKQKSPKKKQKRSASSSSSDSSSNSDSSTCSCGTNCSCSSSSSSSSGSSSSQSSDSDSSSSEGKRRQAARRERRRERAKKRKMEEIEDSAPILADSAEPTAPNGPPIQDDVPSVNTVAEPEEVELPIRESDLDTDETETDEDFYDKYPQRLANKLFAEKRNQLLLLAAVAPVNNGTMSQSGQSPPPSSVEEPIPKKKTKTKKHKKSQHQHSNMESKVESKLKLNIPTDYYSSQSPTFSKSSVPSSSTNNSANSVVLATPARTAQTPFHSSHPESSTPTASYQNTGSGSETDSKRLSKRKRVPKKFYGDSSDEEPDQPPVKWRKVMPATSNSPVTVTQTASSFTYKSSPVSMSEPIRSSSTPIPMNEDKSEEEAAEDSDSDREEVKKSSTESSNSESEGEKEHDDDDDDEPSDDESDVDASSTVQTNTLPSTRESDNIQQKNENLYCYCQCPYDEVSEMIACDGKDCTIEWFHFECVGIMVPPKGKWFCPDCRKRSATKSEFLVSV